MLMAGKFTRKSVSTRLIISESIHLKPCHIDSQRMVIRVEQGKGQRDRYVMLSVRLLELLRHWWRTERPQHWLFPGKSADKPITRHAVEKACQEAHSRSGICKPITPHSFRHYAGSPTILGAALGTASVGALTSFNPA